MNFHITAACLKADDLQQMLSSGWWRTLFFIILKTRKQKTEPESGSVVQRLLSQCFHLLWRWFRAEHLDQTWGCSSSSDVSETLQQNHASYAKRGSVEKPEAGGLKLYSQENQLSSTVPARGAPELHSSPSRTFCLQKDRPWSSENPETHHHVPPGSPTRTSELSSHTLTGSGDESRCSSCG